MSATKQTTVLSHTLFCHAWNADRSMIAVCPNSREIDIYKTNGKEDMDSWEKIDTLREHEHLVTCIDWAPKTNRLLSCSHDRNAFVWDYDAKEKTWKPSLVLLRSNRAALTCKWAPEENKFAVGTGAKQVAVCYYEKENNWWVAKIISKPHRSSVTSLAWHPTNNTILATGSTDFKVRIFNTYIAEVDSKDLKGKFGEPIAEVSAKGWIHDLQYSPSGNRLAFVSHDSTLTVIEKPGSENNAITVNGDGLPYRSLLFVSENAIVAGGHDFTPVAFSAKGSNWVLNGKIDLGETKTASSMSAREKFQKEATVGAKNAASGSNLPTKHQNLIMEVKTFKKGGNNVDKYSTCGLDGRVLVWDVKDISKTASGFAL